MREALRPGVWSDALLVFPGAWSRCCWLPLGILLSYAEVVLTVCLLASVSVRQKVVNVRLLLQLSFCSRDDIAYVCLFPVSRVEDFFHQ